MQTQKCHVYLGKPWQCVSSFYLEKLRDLKVGTIGELKKKKDEERQRKHIAATLENPRRAQYHVMPW